MPPLLYLLALGNLVVGSSAFVITGLIGLIADGLGSSVAAVGLAVTAYALATAFLAPLVVVATGRWPRRSALIFSLLLFTLGNALCAAAPSLPWLYAGRVLLGLGSMFTPIAAGVALSLVAPSRQGQALSTTFLGMSLSYVIGVPLGAWIGLRFGWQAALWTLTAATASMAVLAAFTVPRGLQVPTLRFAGVGAVLRRWSVVSVLLTTMLYFTAIFTVFSYIAPVLAALVPGSEGRLSFTLMIFGLAGVAGTLLGGWGTDRLGPRRTLQGLLLTLAAMMVAIPFTAGHYGWLLAALVVWGTSGFGMMAPQQARLARMAPAQTPLLLSLNTSMLYLGMALGAAVGGPAAQRWGFAALPWVAAPIALAGWTLLMAVRPGAAPGLATGASAPR